MKVCSDCQEEKEDNLFYKKGNRLQSKCKSCYNIYCNRRWKNRKENAVKYKGGQCEDCHGVFPSAVFEFHHLDPSEKEFNWTKMRLVSNSKLLSELDKCALLCANCHRIRHWG